MTADRRSQLGRLGEDLAVAHLRTHGYTILQRNYRKSFGEIDIIARDGAALVFIEVKTRRGNCCGPPALAVTPRKQQQISRVAEDYLARHNLFDSLIRFDVVAILLSTNEKIQIEIITNAFDGHIR